MTNNELRFHREALRLSQARLARLSNVSRSKICLFELGDGKLSGVELQRIHVAIHVEIARLRSLPESIEFPRGPANNQGGAA